ncbi:hypothetical protein E2C01_033479 [Portunus trituberculatus]|uniref:Uncharacterized protein n=1 Tax=Portunus trituberculatus TaxID=210409 RepID=A0A5B7F3J2_PORTR|nr:hypothetical protein [Portunus trituberculatus]
MCPREGGAGPGGAKRLSTHCRDRRRAQLGGGSAAQPPRLPQLSFVVFTLRFSASFSSTPLTKSRPPSIPPSHLGSSSSSLISRLRLCWAVFFVIAGAAHIYLAIFTRAALTLRAGRGGAHLLVTAATGKRGRPEILPHPAGGWDTCWTPLHLIYERRLKPEA